MTPARAAGMVPGFPNKPLVDFPAALAEGDSPFPSRWSHPVSSCARGQARGGSSHTPGDRDIPRGARSLVPFPRDVTVPKTAAPV